MYTKCRGLVIKQTDSGEKGKLLTILTENRGVVYAKATGGKNISAGYFRSCQLFTYSEFHFRGGNTPGCFILLDALYYHSFFDLSKDMERFALASYCTELCKISLVGSDDDKEALRLLLNTLYTIEKSEYPYDHIKAVFEIRLATLLGFEPYLNECDVCGKDLPSEDVFTFFDIGQSCVRCENCVGALEESEDVIRMPAAVYRSVLHAASSAKDDIFKFKTDEETLGVFSEISEKYILRRLECESKSLPLYKSFRSARK